PTSPAISRVRVKGSKKLRVFGQGFSSDAVIWLNGTFLTPREFTHEGTEDVLFYKGRLSLGSSGSNTLYVKNSVGWSGVFSF
ncbi:MAG TPA: hypothetical protein VNS63_12625, partial [Blastocatellia bacterium]|nr:hypothetical protein [Blastocatellia bacterium]